MPQNGPHGHAANMPEPWVLRATHLVPQDSPVIDVACGNGRHGRWFLANDHDVTFVDITLDAVADITDLPRTTFIAADLEQPDFQPARIFTPRRFGGVVVVNYLWRPLLPALVDAVAPGGVLIYQTFAVGNERFGKPSNPDFLLHPGELLEAVRGSLDVLFYEFGEELIEKPAVTQRIVARRPA